MTFERQSFGVFLPIFSLPGNGTLDCAATFVSFLEAAGAQLWQVLPVGPTHEDGSPYLSLSAHAGNPNLIGPLLLSERLGTDSTDLRETFAAYGKHDLATATYQQFRDEHDAWLPDYGLYRALRSKFDDQPWYRWPNLLRDRSDSALKVARDELAHEISYIMWQQFVFFEQWNQTKSFCNSRHVKLFGDVPLYVSHDSADVWQHPELFRLNADGTLAFVAGVPPDYFSSTGQRWGNPLYDWERMAEDEYAWWIRRMQTQSRLYDVVRIDHFRGLESYWEIPATAETGETGEWRKGPGAKLLDALSQAIPGLTMVAEDLGTITQEVDELRRTFAMPGIRVLQFGFDGVQDNPHFPGNIGPNMVLYTGTHDNDTSVGWYQQLPDWQKANVDENLEAYQRPFPDSLTACAFASKATTIIIPMQDLLGLGTECRINTPGTMGNN